MTPSMVYLIGAGPGDPGLMTVKGAECLRAADVVIHDRLVSARLLALARPGTELIEVGPASPRPLDQDAINYLLAEKAREGHVVARLKWGDPFLFDGSGREALFLHEQHIPFEVVPGIPPAIAGPAYAGVPLTAPGVSDTVTLLRGFEDEARTPSAVDWPSLARLGGTVVCYAGPRQLPEMLDAMASAGWPPNGNLVLIHEATLPGQRTNAGTLADLRERVRAHAPRTPAVLVAGPLVGLREHARWFDSRPLFGRRVLVTRPREQAGPLVDRLVALGADAVEAPMIRIEPPEDAAPLLAAAAQASGFDWIVFSSRNAVASFMDALLGEGRDLRALAGPRLCVVGTGTAEALVSYGIRPDLIPRVFTAEGIVTAMLETGPMTAARVLIPHADIGREVVGDGLRLAGADVLDVVAYRTVEEEGQTAGHPDVYRLLLDRQLDVVTFTSPSAVRSFVRSIGVDQAADLLQQVAVASIGPVTTHAARELGLTVAIQPSTHTVPALVEAIAAHFARPTP